MILFIIGMLMFISPAIFFEKFCDNDNYIFVPYLLAILGLISMIISTAVSFSPQPNYNNYTIGQLKNMAVSKDIISATDINIKLVEDNKDDFQKEYYKISYKTDGVTRERKEIKEYVKIVKDDSEKTYIEKLTIKRKTSVAEWLFSINSIKDKNTTVYVVHYV